MPFVSVIIPVYNVEKYLRQCVDSVLNQKIDNVEIILVDDGSSDTSPLICDEYAKNYNNIQSVHKKNGGASSARNSGLSKAQGEYVIFLDSDDWWNPEVCVQDMLSEVKRKQNVEMFLFTSYDYIEGYGLFRRNEHYNLNTIRTDTVENYYQDLLNNGNLEVHAGTKILKRSFLNENKLYFPEGLVGEDNLWMIKMLRKLKCVDFMDKPLYIYRANRVDSVTNTVKKKNVEDLLLIVNDCIKYYGNKQYSEKLMDLELCHASYLWFSALGLSAKLNRAERKEVRELFKKTKSVCAYSNSKKTKLCNLVLKIVGINLATTILGTYIKLKGRYHINRKMLDSN